MTLSHIAYIKTDNLILTQNSTKDAQEFTKDVIKYKIKEVRLMMNALTYIIRYVIDGVAKWRFVTYELRGDDYYISLHYRMIGDESIQELDCAYNQYHREEVLRDLGI